MNNEIWRAIEFDDPMPPPENVEADLLYNREPLELPLVRALWCWAATPCDDPVARQSAADEVGRWIDGFIGRCFRFSTSSASDSWWTDGTAKVVLTQSSPVSINAVGATVWAGNFRGFCLAPFECDFYFASPNAPECERIIVRFGKLNKHGEILRIPFDSTPESVIASRPKKDSDWAFAIEIA
jgi:hypothetical protein